MSARASAGVAASAGPSAGAAADPAAARIHRRSWAGPVFCHVPADGAVRLEALLESGPGPDRWNDPGQPTAYLACDPGVALAEFGRNHAGASNGARRRLLRLELSTDGLVDLRDAATLAALGRSAELAAFLDRAACRTVARRVRAIAGVRGLIVPSVAFLDQPGRCNVVLFGERLPEGIAGIMREASVAGELDLRD